MNFPTGVDYGNFYREAKKQGVKVRSKYTGVYIYDSQGRVIFQSRASLQGKTTYLGEFPLTEEGEQKAYNTYLAARGIKKQAA